MNRGYVAVQKAEQRAKQFAKRYIQNNMNGSKTVRELYNPKSGNVAQVVASEIIRKPIVKRAIQEELDSVGLTNEVLDKELLWIAKQKRQLSPKLGAIVEANKLKSRYPKDSTVHNHLHLQGITDQNIDSKLDDIQREIRELTGNDTPVSL